MSNYKGIIYAILSSVAFGLMPIFAKFAYANGSNPTTVLIARFLLASIILFTYLKCTRVSLKVSKKQLIILLSIGIIGYTLTTQTLFVSYDYLGAGLATTLHFIYPVVVCLIGYFFFKEKMSKSKMLALIFAGLGIYALIAMDNNTLNALGVMLAIFSGISYGVNIIALGLKSIKQINHNVVTMYVCLGATLGMLIYGTFTNTITLTLNLNIGIAYIGIAVISTIASMLLLLKAIATIGTASTSILGTFEPIVSVILGVILFGEPLTLSLIIGTILILASTIILAREKN
nr:DMT family transporter [uncultured Cellulosilyticum sp.]